MPLLDLGTTIQVHCGPKIRSILIHFVKKRNLGLLIATMPEIKHSFVQSSGWFSESNFKGSASVRLCTPNLHFA